MCIELLGFAVALEITNILKFLSFDEFVQLNLMCDLMKFQQKKNSIQAHGRHFNYRKEDYFNAHLIYANRKNVDCSALELGNIVPLCTNERSISRLMLSFFFIIKIVGSKLHLPQSYFHAKSMRFSCCHNEIHMKFFHQKSLECENRLLIFPSSWWWEIYKIILSIDRSAPLCLEY